MWTGSVYDDSSDDYINAYDQDSSDDFINDYGDYDQDCPRHCFDYTYGMVPSEIGLLTSLTYLGLCTFHIVAVSFIDPTKY